MLMLLDGWAVRVIGGTLGTSVTIATHLQTCPNTPADKRNVSDGLVLVTNQQPEMFEVSFTAL